MAKQKGHDHQSQGSSARTLGRVAATLMTASFVIGSGIFGARFIMRQWKGLGQ